MWVWSALLPTVTATYFLPVKWQMLLFVAFASFGGCFARAVPDQMVIRFIGFEPPGIAFAFSISELARSISELARLNPGCSYVAVKIL
jgi:hypothetical protein